MNLLVTNAGLAALVNAEQTGTESVVIGSIQFGSGQYTPTADQTALRTPITTLTALSGGAVSEHTIHVTAEDESTATYTVNEIGVFLSDGTLFAVGSQNTPILQKASGAIALLSVDIALADHSAAAVTVGDTNFFNPPATTEIKGVIEIATDAEVLTGADTSRAVTPAHLKARIDNHAAKVASKSAAGHVKAGLGISVDAAGTIAVDITKDVGAQRDRSTAKPSYGLT